MRFHKTVQITGPCYVKHHHFATSRSFFAWRGKRFHERYFHRNGSTIQARTWSGLFLSLLGGRRFSPKQVRLEINCLGIDERVTLWYKDPWKWVSGELRKLSYYTWSTTETGELQAAGIRRSKWLRTAQVAQITFSSQNQRKLEMVRKYITKYRDTFESKIIMWSMFFFLLLYLVLK